MLLFQSETVWFCDKKNYNSLTFITRLYLLYNDNSPNYHFSRNISK